MRFLLSITLLIPAVCLAIGPESHEYMGFTNDGKLIVIGFRFGEETKWTGDNWIHGSSSHPKFRFCWINEAPIDNANPKFSPRNHTHFVCATARGVKPAVFYKIGGELNDKTANRYKDANVNFKKARAAGYERGNDKINTFLYYVCDKGCDSTMPLFIFDAGYAG